MPLRLLTFLYLRFQFRIQEAFLPKIKKCGCFWFLKSKPKSAVATKPNNFESVVIDGFGVENKRNKDEVAN